MPDTNISGPYGNINIDRIGVAPVYDEDSFTASFMVRTEANEEPPQSVLDDYRCDIPDFMGYGWDIDCFVYIDGKLRSSDGYCTPHRPTVTKPTMHDIYVPLSNAEPGDHTITFQFRYGAGQREVIGSESFHFRKMDSISNADWEPIDKNKNHETGDVIAVETWLDSPAPLPRVAFELAGDLIKLQTKINSELPGQEEITILDGELEEASDPNHDYKYSLVYHVDHASPIAATTVITAIAVAVVAVSITLSIFQVRQMIQNPAGKATVGTGLLIAGGYVGYKILSEYNQAAGNE